MGAAVGAATTAANATNPLGWAMIGAQVLPEIYKYVTGRKQKKMADEFGKTQRPAYEIPQAYKDYLGQAKFNAAVSGLPGQGQLEKKLDRQTASTLGVGKNMSATNAIANAAAADYSTKQALEDTAYDAAKYKAARQQDLYTAETAMAKQQLAQWDWDKKQRYLDAMGAQSALTEASNKNAMTALEGLTGAFQTAGMMGLFGTGDRGTGTAGVVPGTTTTPATTAATPAVSNAMNFGATSDFNQYFGSPNNATEYSYSAGLDDGITKAGKYGFADPNSSRYTYETTGFSDVNDPSKPMYNVTDWNTGKTVPALSGSKAEEAIFGNADPLMKLGYTGNVEDYNAQTSPYDYSQLPIGTMLPQQSASGDMNDYGPGARRAMRRAGGETSQFNVSLPSQMTDNWTNDYFGMEMPTAYGYGNTWNDIMSRIGTQYGLGDVYSDGFNTNLNRQYSRFNPFG